MHLPGHQPLFGLRHLWQPEGYRQSPASSHRLRPLGLVSDTIVGGARARPFGYPQYSMARGTAAIAIKNFMHAVVLIGVSFWVRPCAATELQRAAEVYDSALEHYERAEYAEAAKLFLEADSIHPSTEALMNAMAAARQANENLLVVTAAMRAEARESAEPALAARARQALAEAERKLSRLELSCSPSPCTMTIDGAAAESGRHYVLPGSHSFGAIHAGRTTSRSLLADAGANYRITLEIPPEPVHVEQAGGSENAGFEPVQGPRDGLPAEVFYASLALTGVAAGLTIWSGLDALNKKNSLSDPPTQSSRDELVASVRRTDILLAGTAILAVTTTYVGWKLVDFEGGEVSVAAHPGRYTLSARGSF